MSDFLQFIQGFVVGCVAVIAVLIFVEVHTGDD